MRRWIIRITGLTFIVALIAVLASWWAVRQTRHVPDFYARATERTDLPDAEAIRQIEAGLEKWRSDAGKIGSWSASFNDRQINHWLSEELPRKFPRLLASGAREPRIVIEDGRILAAVRYQRKSIDIVISCQLEVELTEQPNMLALRVTQLRAGALPLPLGKFIKGISKEAARGDLDIRWDHTESDPIALVTVPSDHPKYVVRPVIVESVELTDGELTLSGHSGPLAHKSYHPVGPLYRFVSYQPRSMNNSYRVGSESRSQLR